MKFKKLMRELKYSLHLILHPFDGFWDLKHEKRGSVAASMVILLLVILTQIIKRQFTGYIFNENDLAELNIINEIVGVLIPFFVWCISNWCFTTLFDGEGSFKDIVIASAYALVPLVIINIPVTIISNFIIEDEGALLFFFSNLATVWFGFLMFIGTLVTHQYTALKTIIIVFFVVLGMAIILFIGILFFILTQQLFNFVLSLIKEISLRIA